MKTIEKIALAATLVLFFAAAGVTAVSESRHEDRLPVPAAVTKDPAPSFFTDASVNINTADIDALCTLTGIGPVLAQRIIDYRDEYGFFSDTAGIIDVSGIGFATFEKIKDGITV